MAGKSLSTNFVCSVLKEQRLIDDTLVEEIMLHEKAYLALFQKQEGADEAGQMTGVDIISAMGLRSSQESEEVLSEEVIMRTLASHWRLPFLRIDLAKLDPVIVRSNLPEAVAVKHSAVPVSLSDDTIIIAIVNPLDVEALEAIKKVSTLKIHLAISIKADILKAIKKCYGGRRGVEPVEEEEQEDETTRKFENFFTRDADKYTDQHVVDAVNLLVHYAIEQHTSEIHLKPKQQHSLIQFCIDGVLYNVKRIPVEIHENIVHRLKSLAGLKHSDKPVPQEGRTQFKFHDQLLRLSISSIPIIFGEKIILRLLDPLELFHHIYDLGFSPEELQQYNRLLAQSYGLTLLSGPAGCGKTTSLYSTLQYLSERGLAVTTIEDPIDSVYEDFTQITVHQSIGVTFDIAMQHVMQQTPTALMIGNIHDRETAETAMRAALKGHLVLGGFQAADTLSALVELLKMEIPPSLIEAALTAIVAQRLLRKICEKCAEPYQLSEEEQSLLELPKEEAETPSLRKGSGCTACRGTGYIGQTAIFEIMELTEELQSLIHANAEPHRIRQAASNAGMHSFREGAITKMKAGITTCEEVLRVTGGLQEAIPHTFRSKVTLSNP